MTHVSHSPPPARLAVIGAGAWGTVLATLLARNGHAVTLWARREALAQTMNETRENPDYTPGLHLPDKLQATSDLTESVRGVEAAVIAVPSKGLRDVLERLPATPAFISASKGLEPRTFKRFTQVIGGYHPGATLAALSGPNLAAEIAAGQPAAATLASDDAGFAARAQEWLNSESFRVYSSPDLIGVEVAGALKNVVALAAGMCDGLGLGDNAKASIITRGLAELTRLGTHLGGDPVTFYGLAGLGDVVATCASTRSRNHSAGARLARGETLADLRQSKLNAEGIPTVEAVCAYSREQNLELPIATEVHRVIFENKGVQAALRDLMRRSATTEA